METPSLSSKCANVNCGHALSVHWETYDGRARGCRGGHTGGSDDGCFCNGFVVEFRPPMVSRSNSYAGPYESRSPSWPDDH